MGTDSAVKCLCGRESAQELTGVEVFMSRIQLAKVLMVTLAPAKSFIFLYLFVFLFLLAPHRKEPALHGEACPSGLD